MSMTRLIEVKVYVTPENEPTCARYFPTGDVCPFLYTDRFGTNHRCACNHEIIDRANGIDDLGYLVPHKGCPVWNGTPTKRL